MYNRILLLFAALLVLTLGLVGCSQKSRFGGDPKGRLQQYISQSFAVKSVDDRQKLLALMTGDAKRRLAAWSDDQFDEAFLEKKRKFLKLAWKDEKAINDRMVNVTYELSYLDHGKGKQSVRVTHKKMATLVRKEEKWLISSVRNIKELIEYQNHLTIP